jgi:hypothetical protein
VNYTARSRKRWDMPSRREVALDKSDTASPPRSRWLSSCLRCMHRQRSVHEFRSLFLIELEHAWAGAGVGWPSQQTSFGSGASSGTGLESSHPTGRYLWCPA